MSRMTVYQVFIEVAKRGNFSKAAQELYLTQPAVSQMISSLEQDLGVKLFARQSRGVSLTQEGQVFYQHIIQALDQIDQAEQMMQSMKDLQSGLLRIGVSDTVSRYVLPKSLKRFAERYPHILVQIASGTSQELEVMLQQDQVDLVIGFQPQQLDDYDFHCLLVIHEAVVASAELASQLNPVNDVQELNQVKLMMLDRKSGTRQRIDQALSDQGIDLKPDIELASYELLAAFARESMGLAILSKEFVENLEVISVPFKLPERPMGYYTKKSASLSIASQAFIDELKTTWQV
ncbi:LysR family transcriptional regulator [Vaginisenegalia massiliensis]|uniref:LysR family transcriptional regulator n=1 Tax=Vaginisenegalia massiliensis TaxID=2058294 RepID=UPI0013DDAB51|nr:LysR family transcriptional regulator [Vaginisenegalia massiliensis]